MQTTFDENLVTFARRVSFNFLYSNDVGISVDLFPADNELSVG